MKLLNPALSKLSNPIRLPFKKSITPQLINTTCALSLIAFAAMLSPAALADDSAWYIGANAGQSQADIDSDRITADLLQGGLSATAIDENEQKMGYKLFAGYQFNRYFSLEAGYFDLGKFDFTATTQPAGTLDGSIKLRGINADVLGFIPLGQRFSLFGRVGVNYADTQDNFSGTGAVNVLNPEAEARDTQLKLGIGAQYAVNEAWALRLEGERYRINDAVGNEGDVDLISLGVIYRFGSAAKPTPVSPAPERVIAPSVQLAPPPPKFVKTTLSANELFSFDSAQVHSPHTQLNAIAQALQGEGAPQEIIISGYTDRLGSEQYNHKLSHERAVAVKSYLVNKGINPSRLITEGRGEESPVVVCSDKQLPALIECLAPNRRVEIDAFTVAKEIKN